MKTLEHPSSLPGVRPRLLQARAAEPAYQAYSLLYVGYVLLPLIAGADKFARVLTDWTQYLSPFAATMTGGRPDSFMKAVGVVELAAGLLTAARPRWGAFVVGLWLLGIVANLLSIPGYFDVALRDFGLSLGAFALWRLSGQYGDRRG